VKEGKNFRNCHFFLKIMVFTKDFKFPTDEELTTEEVPLGSTYLRAGAFHYGKYCEAQNNEFMLCRHETRDPVKCLPEGKVVTSCANEFFKKVKATCAESFTQYAMCLEQSTHEGWPEPCRESQVKLLVVT
jgi:NADH dehydrogenase (ubiquinone) 1 alpha subcomplex subunit 8